MTLDSLPWVFAVQKLGRTRSPGLRRVQVSAISAPLLLATITARHADGTVTVAFPGGGAQRVRDPWASAPGAQVFVQDGAVQGAAPNLPFYEIEV